MESWTARRTLASLQTMVVDHGLSSAGLGEGTVVVVEEVICPIAC
jgi:hypothetical protein